VSPAPRWRVLLTGTAGRGVSVVEGAWARHSDLSAKMIMSVDVP
jgi:hypothetical protein